VAYGQEPYERWFYNGNPAEREQRYSDAPTTRLHPAALSSGQHVVRRGETLATIARRYGTGTSPLASANGLRSPYRLEVGQTLLVPAQMGNYRVKAGENLYAIANRYRVDMYELAKLNNLPRPYTLAAGQTLRIPGLPAEPARRVYAQNGYTPARVAPPSPPAPRSQLNRFWPWGRSNNTPSTTQVSSNIPLPPRSSNRFSWPVLGRVTGGFGSYADGQQNDGINIAAPEGTPVRAAENGVVVYANDTIRGYGNMVLIKHSGGWITTYAHNRSLDVRQGQRVNRGQVIARSGARGHVHFEVRQGKRPVNPLSHLESKGFSQRPSPQNYAANRWQYD
jgi:murein DD-endopeptidase MepM/ murein hydrolase activator NlpD